MRPKQASFGGQPYLSYGSQRIPRYDAVSIDAILEPDLMMPGQFRARRGSGQDDSVINLWRRVFADAANCLMRRGKGRNTLAAREEARRWFGDLDHAGPGTLRFCCDIFGFEAGAVSARALAGLVTQAGARSPVVKTSNSKQRIGSTPRRG